MNYLVCDKTRYTGKMPRFQYYYRKCQQSTGMLLLVYRALFSICKRKKHIDLYYKTNIGGGLYIGHPYCITINEKAVIGKNVNIHKGVTIGQENRGERKGTPVIGDEVWIGINSPIEIAIRSSTSFIKLQTVDFTGFFETDYFV